MNHPGNQIDGFVLEHELGRGAMGVVYRARDPRHGRPVALKVILGDAGPEAIERFRMEAAASSRLDHPNVVRVLAAGEAQGRPYLALEFVEGETLHQRLKRAGGLGPAAAARLVSQLARGVAHAHERGVIHRDIKPDNVLLAGDTPRLTDFGLSRFGERHLTQSGAVMGTPAYMSPEQAAGEVDRVGPLSDVYALGAVLYTLIAGHPPFRGNSAINTLRKVLEEPPSPLPQLPRTLQKVLFRALEKEPEQRPASAADFADGLDAWLSAIQRPPARARPATGPRWPLALALTSTVLGLGFLAWFLLGTSERDPPTPPRTPPARDEQPVAQPDETRVRALVKQVADLREARRWNEAQRLLDLELRERKGVLPPSLEFERAYVDLQLGRGRQALESLRALAPRAADELASRAHALLALAEARHLQWEASTTAAQAAHPGTDDWLVLRLLGLAKIERAMSKPDREAKLAGGDLLAQAVDLGDPNPETRAFAVWASQPLWKPRAQLERLARESPSPWADYLLAHHLAHQQPRDTERAVSLSKRALRAAPRWGLLHARVGRLYTNSQLYAELPRDPSPLLHAEKRLERALEQDRWNPWVVKEVCYSLLTLRNSNIDLYARERTQDREAADVFTDEARRLCRRTREILRQTLERYPGFYDARRLDVDANRIIDPKQALADLDRLQEDHPARAELFDLRHYCLRHLARNEEALEALDEAARLDPGYSDRAQQFRRQLGR